MEPDAEQNGLSRRRFLQFATAAGVLALPDRLRAQDPVVDQVSQGGKVISREKVPWQAVPFPMPQVRLLDGIFKRQMGTNIGYLRIVPNDRLLHMFRITAGLPSSAHPLGGKERPTCELRGHFSGGHYLSASALTYATTGDEDIRKKADALVAELAKCQKAHGNGYLSAFPEELFDRLREGKPLWAPFYTLHKIMAGHLDMYTHCGNVQALETLEGMADWVGRWVGPLSYDHMQRVLNVEQGGMLEVLCNLYAVTGREKYLRTAMRFDHHAFFDPLANYQEQLKGLHSNTNIPKVIGAARQYEVTGDSRYQDIASYFWQEVTGRRIYCTGGTSYDEHWRAEPGYLAPELGDGQRAEECCCGYNMLKLTRHIYGWTLDPRTMDYYERTLFNSRLGTQDEHGLKGYFVSVGRGWWKYYNTPFDSFWCCTGTGAEEFSKFNNTIYFHDDEGVFVNLFIASEVDWPEKGVRVRQETAFPVQQGTSLIVYAERPVRMTMRLRVPYWATSGGSVKINGRALPAFASPSSYLTLDRVWHNRDRIELSLPMSLHAAEVPGDATQQAMMFGPLVLAGRLGGRELTHSMVYRGYSSNPPRGPAIAVPDIQADPRHPTAWVEKVPNHPLVFRTAGQEQSISLIPLYQLAGERYAVYWKMNTA